MENQLPIVFIDLFSLIYPFRIPSSKYGRQHCGISWIGFARLFVAFGREGEIPDISLIEQSALVIQKTNILQDFKKTGTMANCAKDVWSKYVNNPGDLLKPENFDKGVACVNELVTDVLQYTIPYLRFVENFRSEHAIKFFGFHQIKERTHQTNGTSQSTLLICQDILHQLQLFQSNKDSVVCQND